MCTLFASSASSSGNSGWPQDILYSTCQNVQILCCNLGNTTARFIEFQITQNYWTEWRNVLLSSIPRVAFRLDCDLKIEALCQWCSSTFCVSLHWHDAYVKHQQRPDKSWTKKKRIIRINKTGTEQSRIAQVFYPGNVKFGPLCVVSDRLMDTE